MTTTKNSDFIISNLKKNGLFFSKFTLISAGQWDFDDADWNYKDIPHLKNVHKLIDAVPTYTSEYLLCSVGLQKIPYFFDLPITITNYDSSNDEQTYYSTILFWFLIITTKIIRINHNTTSVETTYHIGSSRFFQFFIPILRYVISKNYDNLMSGDIPMRERRGFLRKNGFSFKKNKLGKYTFNETTELNISKVIFPIKLLNKKYTYTVDLNNLTHKNKIILGDSIFGLIILNNNNDLFIFRRICDHEGAEISYDNFDNKYLKMKCPWHGKLINPIATLKNQKIFSKIDSINVNVDNNNILSIEYYVN